MADRKYLLCFVFLILLINTTQCKRFGGGRSSSSGRHSGGSSHSGFSWFSSSKPSKPSYSSHSNTNGGSHSYPSSNGWSGTSSSSGTHSYPSSNSWSGSSSSSGSHSYPSSNSGLSGSGSYGTHNYPQSTSGLSGNKPSGSSLYPTSNSGLSGSSGSRYPTANSGLSGSHTYPQSAGGLSGNKPPMSGSHLYPTSNSGLSGSSGSRYPTSNSGSSGSHSYPQSNGGLSGTQGSSGSHLHSSSNTGSNYRPPSSVTSKPLHSWSNNRHEESKNYHNNYNTNTGYGNSYHYNHGSGYYGNQPFHPSSYFAAPQHVYITEYRNSGSRYGDLLTGLALYNLGRSHSHHHNYYYDDYYRRRYETQSNYNGDHRPQEQATCTLQVKQNGRLEVLKVPCEIVSTFTEGSNSVSHTSDQYVNTTVCITNTTITNNTDSSIASRNITNLLNFTTPLPYTIASNTNTSNASLSSLNNVTHDDANYENVSKSNNGNNFTSTETPNIFLDTLAVLTPVFPTTEVPSNANVTNSPNLLTNVTLVTESMPKNTSNITNSAKNKVNDSVSVVNTTTCTTTVKAADPVKMKGAPVNTSGMECAVEIATGNKVLRQAVDCSVLTQYSKMPEPKKESSILPSREKLKSWVSKPPWWMAMFIAV